MNEFEFLWFLLIFIIIKTIFSVRFMYYCLSRENSGVRYVLFPLLLFSSVHIVSAPPLLFDPNYFTGSFSSSFLRTETHWIASAQWQRLQNPRPHYHTVTVVFAACSVINQLEIISRHLCWITKLFYPIIFLWLLFNLC